MYVKQVEVVERIYGESLSPFTCCPVNRKYSRKKSQIEKKNASYALQNVRTNPWCMVDEQRLESFITEVLITQELVH